MDGSALKDDVDRRGGEDSAARILDHRLDARAPVVRHAVWLRAAPVGRRGSELALGGGVS